MGEHYFTVNPEVDHDYQEIDIELLGNYFTFITDAGVFSRNRIDLGSQLMIKVMDIQKEDKILDMGCGYGPLGLVAAKLAPLGQVLMVDINQRAVDLAKNNVKLNHISNAKAIQSDGFSNIDEKDFDVILMNPPFRAGKKVVYTLIEKAKEFLKINGSLYTVCMTRQGAKSLAKKMEEAFGEVYEVKKGSGYRVYRAVRK